LKIKTKGGLSKPIRGKEAALTNNPNKAFSTGLLSKTCEKHYKAPNKTGLFFAF
jgi:hypothetical protein